MSRQRSAAVIGMALIGGACATPRRVSVSPPPGLDGIRQQCQQLAPHFVNNHAQADDRPLLVSSGPSGHVPGTVARIEPRDDANQLTGADLAAGVIVARIIVHGGGDYPKYGLPDPGVVCLYVRHGVPDSAVFVPMDPMKMPKVITGRQVRFDDYPGTTWGVPLARWVYNPADDDAWVTCTSSGCCYISGT